MNQVPLRRIYGCLLWIVFANLAFSQTTWTGSSNDLVWNTSGNWSSGLPSLSLSATIGLNSSPTITVSTAGEVQGIQKGGTGSLTITGSSLTLGGGHIGTFNSILVNTGSLTINSALINTQNKRITLNTTGTALTLNGNLDTGGVTTQIGNLNTGGTLTFNGNRSGGNSLILRDGLINTTGILANLGGGNARLISSGTVVSSRTGGPAIEGGSAGLVLESSGTFKLGANNQIAGLLDLSGGTLDLDTFSNSATSGMAIQRLEMNVASAVSTLKFDSVVGSSLSFAEVASTWATNASLVVTGFGAGDSLRFGTNASSLTLAQLNQITINGVSAQIDQSGFVTPIPEASTFGILMGAGCLFGALYRRRCHQR